MLTKISSDLIENFVIDYSNQFKCYFTTKNETLVHYIFKYNDKEVCHLTKSQIDYIRNTLWFDWDLSTKVFSIEELVEYKDFDDLYIVGESYVYNITSQKYISTPIYFDMNYMTSYLDLEDSEKNVKLYYNSLYSEYIKKYHIVEIPCYNQNEKKDFHYSMEMEVLLPDEIYNELYYKNSIFFRNNVIRFLSNYRKN